MVHFLVVIDNQQGFVLQGRHAARITVPIFCATKFPSPPGWRAIPIAACLAKKTFPHNIPHVPEFRHAHTRRSSAHIERRGT